MKQSRLHSLIEQFVNAGLKFGTAMFCWQFIAAPLYGIPVTVGQNFGITFIFFLNSLFFGYWIRRGFDYYHHKE